MRFGWMAVAALAFAGASVRQEGAHAQEPAPASLGQDAGFQAFLASIRARALAGA